MIYDFSLILLTNNYGVWYGSHILFSQEYCVESIIDKVCLCIQLLLIVLLMFGQVYQQLCSYHFQISDKSAFQIEIKAQKDPWIPTSHVRPARPNVLVVHPKMTVINLKSEIQICFEPNDIPFIQNLSVMQFTRGDKFC